MTNKKPCSQNANSIGWRPYFILNIVLLLLFSSPDGKAAPLSVVDLSGTWGFTPEGGAATTIQLPGGGWYKRGFRSINEADYERTITVPNIGQPQVTRIEIGAVNYQATLYVNEVPVGTNTTSFTPSSFDITPIVSGRSSPKII